MSTQNKTVANDASVDSFLSQTVTDPKKLDDCKQLVQLMTKITGKKARMWGSSIIGFDEYHYVYDSGREGDMCVLGFSPRKANITIYFVDGFDKYTEYLQTLGKFKISKVCLYIKNLADINLDVLENMLRISFTTVKKQ